ncbi:MAG: cysteine desulfurase NifS [Methanobrevibacter sp.]|uniref:cysteine desulfurase NifS n=1 Tax=Methanobrevibacter sp. TaxID=66852 RepID=UPI0026E0786C|nr:cysteine desulfurase NifS [Methanobrevibacter sp.]MDO5849093.1 cysteine desulfurase NifS [Methanobrevibacter sp.]
MYMDNSATTPTNEEVVKEMLPYFTEEFGNPSTIYKLGQESKVALEEARKRVADALNAKPEEIIFTSGGSESDNMAIKGIAFKNKDKGKHIITSNIEHPAVKNTLAFLEGLGFEVTYLPVYENGIVKVEDVENAIRDDTILITIMHGNNEIGTIQPIAEIGKIANEHGIKFHTDAVQTFGKIPVDVEELGVDLLSVSSHKIYGPKGVGALYLKKGTRIEPLIHGGGQERGLRSGTENIPGIVGFGKAAEMAAENLDENYEKLITIRDAIIDKVLEEVPESYLNGDRYERLPNIINFRFSAIEGESLILLLSAKGIDASTGSACSSKDLQASPILQALGLPVVDIHGSLRLSLGLENSMEDVDTVTEAIKEVVARLREMSPLWNTDEKYDDMMCGSHGKCKK